MKRLVKLRHEAFFPFAPNHVYNVFLVYFSHGVINKLKLPRCFQRLIFVLVDEDVSLIFKKECETNLFEHVGVNLFVTTFYV